MARPYIVVTGGAGFIGSNIVAELSASRTHRIAVCDVLGKDNKWRNLAQSLVADFIFPDQLFDFLDDQRGPNKGGVDAIIHMGAISSTTERDADLIVQNNFQLSRVLWDWCATHKVRFIYASSAATYGDGAHGFEDTQNISALEKLRPLNAYGWSKHAFDLFVADTVEAGELVPPQWAGLKFFNVYGPNEYHKGGMRSVVSQIFDQLLEGTDVELFRSHNPNYADGGQLRDFVFVKDCVQVVKWLLETPHISGIYNLGTGHARSFLDLAQAVFKALDKKPAIKYIDTPRKIRDKYQYFTEARMDKLRQAGYPHQFTPLETGVDEYVKAYLLSDTPYR